MNTLVMPKPLGILDTVELSDEEMAALEKLDAAKFPYVREKLIKSGEVTAEEMDEVEREFKRFMALNHLGKGPIRMTSKKIDAFWHQFILFTRQYFDFCMLTFGHFIHHDPWTRETSNNLKTSSAANFEREYTAHFGPIPAVWNFTNDLASCMSGNDDDCNGDHGQDD